MAVTVNYSAVRNAATNPAAAEAAEAARAAAEAAQANAETAEANAETAETNAEAAQLAAETARDTALALGRLFADTTTGLAAVGANEFFLVPTTAGEYTALTLYQDVAGVATKRGEWSISYFETSILGQQVFADKNGNVFAYYDQNGELRLKGHARGVHQRFDDSRAQSFISNAVALGSQCIGNTGAAPWVRNDSQYIDTTLGGTSWASEPFLANKAYGGFASNVSGPPYYPAYRNPTLLQIAPGHCLLFCTELEIPQGNDDQKSSRIMVSDVYFDFRSKALTCSAARVAVDDRAFTSGSLKAIALGHTPVLVRTGPHKGRIWMLFTSNKDDPGSITFAEKPYLIYSDDNGQTWDGRVELPVATGSYNNLHGYGTGMKGIQLKYGQYKGRLIFPWYGPVGASTTTKFFSVYSDDGGDNWTKGTESGTLNISEPSYAEDIDGTVYAACRHPSLDSGATYWTSLYKSTDGGVNWTLVTTNLFQNSGVEVSTTQAAECTSSTPKMLMARPTGTSERSGLTVSRTYDGWTTSVSKLIDSGNSGYSGIESIGEDYFVLAWEKKYFSENFSADSIMLMAFNNNYIG
jgi:hypothetical protein